MKSFSKYHYLLSFIAPIAAITCLLLGSWYVFIPVIQVALFPLLDVALGRSRTTVMGRETFFDAILYAHVALHIVLMLIFFVRIGSYPFFSIQWMAAVLGVSLSAIVSAIAAGHELIHAKTKFGKHCGLLLLLLTNYIHFGIEHMRSHHPYVGTKKDSATAMRGESLLAFYIRTIPGQYLSVLRLSAVHARVRRQFIAYTAFEILLYIGILAFFGVQVFVAWLAMSLIVILNLEYANYIRHWGLERALDEDVSPLHSWQSDAIWSRAVFLDLPVHSDHHVSNKPFNELQFFDTNRYLPSGYFATFWIATITPVWKRIMLAKIREA